jgi:hypothetical protein
MSADASDGGAAFIVLAHTQPQQVARLAARLAPLPVFLHVDAGLRQTEWTAFRRATASLPSVSLLPRRRSGWASWGLVRAALDGISVALRDPRWTHLMLLSGQDYPLWPADAIARFFVAHRDTTFMAHWRLPSRLWGPSGGLDRVRYWHMPVAGRRLRAPVPRRLPRGFQPYGGSMYWALTRGAAETLVEYVKRQRRVVRFYRHTWIPDEMFVPTAIMNSPACDSVANESLTFIRWPAPGARHPSVLRCGDLEDLRRAAAGPSDVGGYGRCKLFARKFDPVIDAAVFERIDRELLGGCTQSNRGAAI